MSAEEVGAYIRLLCYQWSKEGLPNDDQKLSALGGCCGNAVASIRHKLVICQDGKLRNARLESVRTESAKYRQKQAEKAKKRWDSVQPDAVAMPQHSHGIDSASIRHMPEACPSSSSSLEEDTKKRPSLEVTLAYAKSPQGNIPPDVAEIWWNENESRPLHASGYWTDRNGNPINFWQKALRAYGLKWRNNEGKFQRQRKPTVAPGFSESDNPGKFDGPSMAQLLERASEEVV